MNWIGHLWMGWVACVSGTAVAWGIASRPVQESGPVPESGVAQPATPDFSGSIAAVVFEKCSICHRPGQVGPFPLLTYRDVSSRSKTIAATIRAGYMPPWKPLDHGLAFSNDRSLSPSERERILAWIDAGCPEGDPARTPPIPAFPDGWTLGKPDLIVRMKDPFPVPADGPDLYRSFVFPLQLPDDKWVKAVELRPQANAAMHHALFFLDSTGSARKMDGRDGQPGIAGMGFLAGIGGAAGGGAAGSDARGGALSGLGRLFRSGSPPAQRENIDAALARGLGGYVPGAVPSRLPGDLAMELPAGSDIVMQTHFHPSGKPESEQAELGLYLADREPSKRLVPIQIPAMFGFGAGIDIPAGEPDFRIRESFTLPVSVQAISVGGHAHYICSRMKMTARLPDGRETVLLEIDDWDLDWQDRYLFASPVELPAGTVLESEICYDNSSANPENPYHPPRRIRWGRQSNDEMGSITLAVVASDEKDRPRLQEQLQQHFRSAIVSRFAQGRGLGQLILQLDEDRDGKLQPSEAPPRLSGEVFSELDRDGDGALDESELSGLTRLLRLGGQLTEGEPTPPAPARGPRDR